MAKVIVTYTVVGKYAAELDDGESDPQDWALDYILTNDIYDSRNVHITIMNAETGDPIL